MASSKKVPLRTPVYDDWGNLVGGGKGVTMAEAEEAIKAGAHVGAMLVDPSRTIERKQGCWNCTAFEATDVYISRVKDAFRRDVKVFLDRGASLARAGESAAITRDLLYKKRGYFGVCLVGAVEGDFVACKHICDKWNGKVGVTGSFSPGEPYDPLVEEVYDRIGDGVPAAGDEKPEPDA